MVTFFSYQGYQDDMPKRSILVTPVIFLVTRVTRIERPRRAILVTMVIILVPGLPG